MGYGDYYWGRDYYRDPFPHSLLSTREKTLNVVKMVARRAAKSKRCDIPEQSFNRNVLGLRV